MVNRSGWSRGAVPFGRVPPPRKRSWRPVGAMRGGFGLYVPRSNAAANRAAYASRLVAAAIARSNRRRYATRSLGVRWARRARG